MSDHVLTSSSESKQYIITRLRADCHHPTTEDNHVRTTACQPLFGLVKRHNARYAADGHKTDISASVKYSTIVSRDSVYICLTIAALSDLNIIVGDIENAYMSLLHAMKNAGYEPDWISVVIMVMFY